MFSFEEINLSMNYCNVVLINEMIYTAVGF